MKQILPVLFLFFFVLSFPKITLAAISLEISNIEKGDSFYSLNALLSGIASSSSCYVQVAITTPGNPHYFGQTWSSKGEWLKYLSSTEKEFIKNNFIKLENGQTTKIIFNTDPDDADYKGPGEYLVKLKRYTGESNSPAGESTNSLSFTIADTTPSPSVNPEPTVTPTNSPTISITSTPTPTKTSTPTPTKTPTPNSTVSPSTLLLRGGTPTRQSPTPSIKTEPIVLGDSTGSSQLDTGSNSAAIYDSKNITAKTQEIKINNPANYKTPFFVGLFLAVSSGSLLYFRHRKD